MSKFFTTTDTSEVKEITAELIRQGFIEQEPCGDTNNLFIDTVNKIFWFCNDDCMKNNKSIVKFHLEETIQQATLKIIQSWQK